MRCSIYTSSDRSSKLFAIRQAVRDGMVRKLKALIEEDCGKIKILTYSLVIVIACECTGISLEINVNEWLHPIYFKRNQLQKDVSQNGISGDRAVCSAE